MTAPPPQQQQQRHRHPISLRYTTTTTMAPPPPPPTTLLPRAIPWRTQNRAQLARFPSVVSPSCSLTIIIC
jgi:hypothetical protein